MLHQSPDKRGVPLPVKMVSQLTQTWQPAVKFGHSVKSPHTDLCLSFLIFEPPRSQFRPDHTFPTTNLCFRATALIVAASDLPCQSAVRLYLGDVLVAEGWIIARFQGENGVFWRWNDDLDCIAKTRREQISGRGAVIGPIRQKSRNRPVELIQKPGQGRAIADVVQRQIRADDLLAGCEVQAEV